MTKATETDFQRLFGVAKAHGLTYFGLQSIAQTELGKPLTHFTKEELEAFANRICPGAEEHESVPATEFPDLKGAVPTTDYAVNFMIRGSFLSFEAFVDWANKTAGPKAENLFIQKFYVPWKEDRSRGEFWQQSRRCDCGSHFFENGSVMSKVKCSRCGKEFDVQ